ncbi:serine/threonine protein kinase [Spirillospora sp. CA-142024]|uniref:serine/threonine protein kinase n=1 Tax=Spirillospora sp. CA-142024 TaxID=3240036 RepID=UPI003D91B7F5
MADPQVPEHRRFCNACGEPVGRGRNGRPGRTEGFRPKCGAAYSCRIRALTGAGLVLVLTLGLVSGIAATGLRGGLHRIGQQEGPQVVATSDLYFDG